MTEYMVTIDEEQRLIILMALAHLAVERPGLDDALERIAMQTDDVGPDLGPAMYRQYKRLHARAIPRRPRRRSRGGDMEELFP